MNLPGLERLLVSEHEITLRAPCEKCGSAVGYYYIVAMQRPVYCRGCKKYCGYNASRLETGEAKKSVRSSPHIPPSQRYRILERDGFRCCSCGRGAKEGVTLHVDHVQSRADLKKRGHTNPAEVNADTNLATACEECNLGKGARSLGQAQ